MAGISIRIDDADTRAALDEMKRRAINMGPAMDEIGARMVTSTQLRFERGIDPDGVPWKPSIRALAEGGKTLIDQAFLLGSITHNFDENSTEIGTNMIYGAIHQLGGQAGRGKAVTIPQRAYLGVDADDRRMIPEVLTDYLREGLR